jgi:xylulokinase
VADDLYIGIDLGTTGIKVGLFAGDGWPVAEAAREMHLETPQPGFAEFDGKAYADLCFDAIRQVLAADDTDAAGVKVIGFSSQAETFVLLGQDDLPVRPAISWLDVRAESQAQELSQISGRNINAMTSCPKVLWLKRNEPESLTRARRMLVVNDYLIYLLTGKAATDPVTARSTGGYDQTRNDWDQSVLKACGLSKDAVSTVMLPGQIAGQLTVTAAEALGLSTEVLVAVGTNDQTVGAIGAGNVRPGCASVSMGTALAVMVSCDNCADLPEGLSVSSHPAAGSDGASNIILAFAKTSGVILKWFRETLAPELDYPAIFAEIATVEPGSEGLICLPHFSGTGTPDFNPVARGAFYGLSLAHTRAHMARAIIESLSFTVRENLELIAPTAKADSLRAIGGGARSDLWCQMIADVTGLAVERPRVREAACLGAAELAMVAGGRYQSLPACSDAIYSVEQGFEPDAATRIAYDQAYGKYRQLRELLYKKD